jgi:hypothetical protein
MTPNSSIQESIPASSGFATLILDFDILNVVSKSGLVDLDGPVDPEGKQPAGKEANGT